MNATLSVALVYVGILIVLAAWSRRETHSLSGYYLAGKKLPYWVVAFSTNATGESGWLLLGLTGMGWAVGAQAYWVLVGEVIGVYLSWTLISKRLKRLSDDADAITVPDVLTAKFDDKWHLIRGAAVLIIMIMVTTYVAAQMSATGKAVESFSNFDYQTGMLIGAAVIIIYTIVGGYKVVSYTDVLQGVLMLIGLIVMPAAAIYASGGLDSMIANLERLDPSYLNMFAFDKNITGWVAVISFMAIGLPFLGVPQLLVRYMSARDEVELHKARTVSVIVLFLFMFGAVTAGIAGRALFPELADRDTIFPVLATQLFPPLLTGVLLVIVLSAIMSTVDSLLLLASSAVVRDTMQKIFGSQKSDAQLAMYGKLLTLVIGAVAVGLAIQEKFDIFWFVLFSWSGLGAAFGPVVLCLLYYKGVTRQGVLAGMLAGFLTSALWLSDLQPGEGVFVLKDLTYNLFEAVPGFLAGFAATFLVSRLTRKSSA